ncbi:hypothetical protein EJB05_44556 [Eragrostis curvula]|uniref:Uncharacterized protein n=1 Tax=Eragrostis curvula TaxID=38414 RepID=A0A5J9TJC8_9POAL|nr:hypothetical protein EJB05_44556 [Eragrostis curvula]
MPEDSHRAIQLHFEALVCGDELVLAAAGHELSVDGAAVEAAELVFLGLFHPWNGVSHWPLKQIALVRRRRVSGVTVSRPTTERILSPVGAATQWLILRLACLGCSDEIVQNLICDHINYREG